MKKFLSLVLALVMTMSLVTISAGATEYKDLTDKDEIQYEEAVAVLNRIGIITGYSDGSFQPKTELTRGAAAKIIVSLLIGTEAANNLVASAAPYSDVPVDHTFAGVISFCKTSKIIDGYSDGTFRPAGTLSGYAFSKMLLGALGYKGEYEGGFTGAGWTMNVARIGNSAGLFDRLSFKGNEPVNREQACQLALNTLKATTVEYTGGLTVTAGDASVVGGQQRNYVTSNNRDFALNISARSVEDGWWTVEFGEEHFVDLRLEHDKRNPTRNDLGQPSAEWSYKKVTIGTYPLEPDFSYNTQVIHTDSSSTDASRTRALGLSGYEVDDGTNLWLNGARANVSLNDVSQIAAYTDNGAVVEVYVSETDADYITDVVVIQSALMEVKRIGSDYVALDKYDDNDGPDTNHEKEGFNADAFTSSIENVQKEDDAYAVVSGLKVGDKVVVIPVSVDHSNTRYEAYRAYVPEEVSGALTRVDTYGSASGSKGTIEVTVGGTSYKVSQWNKDLIGITGDDIKVTVKDVTLTLDEYGNALLAEDVGSTSEYMVVGNYYQSLVDGRLVTMVHGWDVSGNEVDLNLGVSTNDDASNAENVMKPGDLVQYTNDGKVSSADWKLLDGSESGNSAKIFSVNHQAGDNNDYSIKRSNTRIALSGVKNNDLITSSMSDAVPSTGTLYYDKSVKFIYVSMEDGEVESIEIKNGVQEVSHNELMATVAGAVTGTSFKNGENDGAQAYVKGKDADNNVAVKAVVIKRESNSAVSSNLLYVTNYYGSDQKDSTGKIVHGYTVAMNTPDGLKGEEVVYSYEDLKIGDFASYAEQTHVDGISSFYKLRQHNSHATKTTSSLVANLVAVVNENQGVLELDTYKTPRGETIMNPDTGAAMSPTAGAPMVGQIDADAATGNLVGELKDLVRVGGAVWVDMTNNNVGSAKDLKELRARGAVTLALVLNDNPTSDDFREVSMVIVKTGPAPVGGSGGPTSTTVSFGTPTNALVQYRLGSEGEWTDWNPGASPIRIRNNERVEFMVSVVNAAVNTEADVHLNVDTGIAKRGDIYTIPASALTSGLNTVTVKFTAAPAPTYALSAAATGWTVSGVTTPHEEGDAITLTLTSTGTVTTASTETLNTALTPTTDFTLTGTGIAAADCTVKVTQNSVVGVAAKDQTWSGTKATFTAGAATEAEWNTAVAASVDGKLYTRTGAGNDADPYKYTVYTKPDFANAPGNTVDLDAVNLYACTQAAAAAVDEKQIVLTIQFTMPASEVSITAFSLV